MIIEFAILNSYGGKINLFVQPSNSFKLPIDETELSMARITVVPTAQILFLLTIPSFIISAEACSIITLSLSILCLDKSSTSTGEKDPNPTCKVISENLIPFISSLFIKCLEKCNPAVGAATAPSFFAYIV